MASKTVGYMVTQDCVGQTWVERGYLAQAGKGGITVFPDRKSADNAIRSTNLYAKEHGYDWSWSGYAIHRLVPA